MARKARERSESGYYHVILKGINSQILFEEDEDREEFLGKLEYYQEIQNFEIHGYCLMDNHVHIIVKDNEETLDKFMKSLCISYALYFNKKYERSGPLFNDRYKSEPIENDIYYITVQRYIHQNPYKAGIEYTSEYEWSSYGLFIESRTTMINTKFLIELLGGIERFVEYMNEDNVDICLDIPKDKLTDKVAMKYILSIGEVDNLQEVKNIDERKRTELIRKCKDMNMSIRQICRLTGLKKWTIENI